MSITSVLLIDGLYPLLLAPLEGETDSRLSRFTLCSAPTVAVAHAQPYSNMLTREIVLIGSFRGRHNGEKRRLKDLFFYSPQLGLKAARPHPPLPHQFFYLFFSCGVFWEVTGRGRPHRDQWEVG